MVGGVIMLISLPVLLGWRQQQWFEGGGFARVFSFLGQCIDGGRDCEGSNSGGVRESYGYLIRPL